MYIAGKEFAQMTIHTPVKADRLTIALQGYSDAFLVCNGFEQGFDIGVKKEHNLKPETRLRQAHSKL